MSNEPDPGETPTPPAPAVPPTDPPTEPKPTETVEFWKAQARENEKRAKANADAVKELDKLRAANMTDTERTIAETKAATRTEVLREVGADRAADQVRLAASNRPIDVDALLEGLDLTKFVNDDGRPDTKAITAYVDRIAPAAPAPEPRVPRVTTGPRGSGKPEGDPAQDFAKFITGQLSR